MIRSGFTLTILLLTGACSNQLQKFKAPVLDFPVTIDTRSKPIERQERKTYYFDTWGIRVDNLFAGARLNNALAENDSVIRIEIRPENKPINPSPWYGFRVESRGDQQIYFRIAYDQYKHRYNPKISMDNTTWTSYDEALLQFNADSTEVIFPVHVSDQPKWIAAQEIVTSAIVRDWCTEMSIHPEIDFHIIGQSALKLPLLMLDIGHRVRRDKKPIIVILSRQHPPEVTGYFAMQYFVERLAEEDELAQKFRSKYRVLVFPLLNPDGVNEGHWRHNIGGIDLNRDWAYYRQPEIKHVADRIVAESKTSKGKVIIGLDFHSTWHDVYYTNTDTLNLSLPFFKDEWLGYIDEQLEDYTVNERPSNVGQPVSKGWFYKQFNAVGVTYEIGDATPREFIKKKSNVSAEALMNLVLKEN